LAAVTRDRNFGLIVGQNFIQVFFGWVTSLGCEYLRRAFWPDSYHLSSIYLELLPCIGKSPAIIFLIPRIFTTICVVDLITQLQPVGSSALRKSPSEVSFSGNFSPFIGQISFGIWGRNSTPVILPYRANLLWHLSPILALETSTHYQIFA